MYYTRYMDLRSIVRGYKEKTGIDIEKEMEKMSRGSVDRNCRYGKKADQKVIFSPLV